MSVSLLDDREDPDGERALHALPLYTRRVHLRLESVIPNSRCVRSVVPKLRSVVLEVPVLDVESRPSVRRSRPKKSTILTLIKM